MQTFFHILAVVISIFIPLVSIILLESKTYALRSLDRSLLPPYPLSLHVKKCTKKTDTPLLSITGMVQEKMMQTTKSEWENCFEKHVLVFMLLIWMPLKVQNPSSLPLAAIWSLLLLRQEVLTPGSQIYNMKKTTGRFELYNTFGDVILAAALTS